MKGLISRRINKQHRFVRKIINNIAHLYEDEPQQAADSLNVVYISKLKLDEIYANIKTITVDRENFIKF